MNLYRRNAINHFFIYFEEKYGQKPSRIQLFSLMNENLHNVTARLRLYWKSPVESSQGPFSMMETEIKACIPIDAFNGKLSNVELITENQFLC